MDSYNNALRSGISSLPIEASAAQQEALLAYLDLMIKWNKAYNLTAIRDPLQMVTRHLLDSLSILPFLPQGRILDVGTGGGLPGVVLAIMCPDREIHLLDSNGKTFFLLSRQWRAYRNQDSKRKKQNALPMTVLRNMKEIA